MLRAHKLGVLVPLVYHTDVESGRAVVEDVAGRPLAALLEAAVAEAGAAAAAESSSGTAAAGARLGHDSGCFAVVAGLGVSPHK